MSIQGSVVHMSNAEDPEVPVLVGSDDLGLAGGSSWSSSSHRSAGRAVFAGLRGKQLVALSGPQG